MPDKSLETRLSVVEIETEHIKETLHELKEKGDNTYNLILAVKENQDKQNGILPKIWEKVEDLGNLQQEGFVKQESVTTKVKIMWAIVSAIGTGVVGLVVWLITKG